MGEYPNPAHCDILSHIREEERMEGNMSEFRAQRHRITKDWKVPKRRTAEPPRPSPLSTVLLKTGLQQSLLPGTSRLASQEKL